jgi:hypothetical protein
VGFFQCEDPTVCQVGDEDKLGDSACDVIGGYNTERCGWDSGDCCESTCRGASCGLNVNGTEVGFNFCLNTDICNVNNQSQLGNGFCNGGDYNTDRCNWDGGDCCAATCRDGEGKCGESLGGVIIGYPQCENPNVCNVRNLSSLGDGLCNTGNNSNHNTELCDWDGSFVAKTTCCRLGRSRLLFGVCYC